MKAVDPQADRFAVPEEELRRRWTVLQASLREEELDALLLTSERNFEYVTGLRTPAWLIKSRPMAVVVPATGDAVPLLPGVLMGDLAESRAFARARSYSGLEPEASQALLGLLSELGLSRARIGVEAGLEQRLGLSPNDYASLSAALPHARFVDAAEVIWLARMAKSRLELDRMATAGRITGDAYESLLAAIDSSWTERRVYTEFATHCIKLGADGPGYVTITGGPGAFGHRTSRPQDRRFRRGELFWIDAGCVYGSYFSDYTRCAAIGEASGLQVDLYRRVRAVLEETLAAVRPGTEASAVHAAALAAADRAGLELVIPTRVGHGIGLDVTEPPSLGAFEHRALLPGMALAVEVGVESDAGWCHLEENVVVIPDGQEFLSRRLPSELPTVGVSAAAGIRPGSELVGGG